MSTPPSPFSFFRWHWPVAFVLILALLHLAGPWLGSLDDWAVFPRRGTPWWGAWSFQWRHVDGAHLWSNAVPLLALGTLFSSVYPKAAPRSWGVFLLTLGPLLWLWGREVPHVGASGIVFALFHALVALALLRRDRQSVATMFVATAVFGGLWLGALRPEEGVSWEGHLSGVVVGWAVALLWFRLDPKPPVFVFPDEHLSDPTMLDPPPPSTPEEPGHPALLETVSLPPRVEPAAPPGRWEDPRP